MTNWKPLAIVLISVFLLGLIFNLIFNAIGTDISNPNEDSLLTNSILYTIPSSWIKSNIIDTIDTGITLFGFGLNLPVFNPFVIVGNDGQEFLISQLNVLTYLPDQISIPFTILFLLAFFWSAIALIKPGSN